MKTSIYIVILLWSIFLIKSVNGSSFLSKETSFITKTSVPIQYFVPNALGRMRGVVFQKGKLLTIEDETRKNTESWCMLQVQLELDQNTKIPKGDKWKSASFKKINETSKHRVISWSFVDPISAKVSQKFKRYTPFNLICQINKDEIFDIKLFEDITGNRIKIESKNIKTKGI